MPTVILAKTVKGWTLGPGVEARNITHQAKKLSEAELKIFRDRIQLPIPDAKLKDAPYYHPGPKSEEVEYLMERRRALGGPIPKRVVRNAPLPAPAADVDAEFDGGSQTAVSTTMVFTRILRNLIRQPDLGSRIVPIIPDEARTFGMDPLFKEVGIYSALGQRYEPVDSDLVLSYREATDGQVLEEGITEAGSMASFQAAGTAYASHGFATIPFYIFYSMFGFQRTGDQMWAFGDARGRGFLMGATAGRTTLTGEGLQHDDGHTHILASTIPNLRAYDPAFAYELAAVVRDGVERMYGPKPEDVYYYVTLYNENYLQPARPEGVTSEDILRGIYRFAGAPDLGRDAHPARLVGSGAILQQVLAARDLLAEQHGVAAEVFSAPSFPLLRRDALETERWNRLHIDAKTAAGPARQPRPAVRWRADRGRLGLDEGPPRHGQPLAAAALPRPRHRRLRPERHARGPAHALRDRPTAHRGGHARRRSPAVAPWSRRRRPRASVPSASTPTRRTHSPSRRASTRRAAADRSAGADQLEVFDIPGDQALRVPCGARLVDVAARGELDVVPRPPRGHRHERVDAVGGETERDRPMVAPGVEVGARPHVFDVHLEFVFAHAAAEQPQDRG